MPTRATLLSMGLKPEPFLTCQFGESHCYHIALETALAVVTQVIWMTLCEESRHFQGQSDEETGPWGRKTETGCSCEGDGSEKAAVECQPLAGGLSSLWGSTCRVRGVILQHLCYSGQFTYLEFISCTQMCLQEFVMDIININLIIYMLSISLLWNVPKGGLAKNLSWFSLRKYICLGIYAIHADTGTLWTFLPP